MGLGCWGCHSRIRCWNSYWTVRLGRRLGPGTGSLLFGEQIVQYAYQEEEGYDPLVVASHSLCRWQQGIVLRQRDALWRRGERGFCRSTDTDVSFLRPGHEWSDDA